ncbi:MAG: hypothetical protein BGO67_04070 [Alphaproteobacteria bacterium 41-28]|nr:MAG: hypothetical protein BGO67_04070 [Alphaproteobacteria bacterium 41-28]
MWWAIPISLGSHLVDGGFYLAPPSIFHKGPSLEARHEDVYNYKNTPNRLTTSPMIKDKSFKLRN